MRYLAGQQNAAVPLIDPLQRPEPVSQSKIDGAHNEKWPLRWTVLGVVAICSAFWVTILAVLP